MRPNLQSVALLSVWFAVILHLWWAVLVAAYRPPLHTTPLHALYRLMGHSQPALASLLIIVATLALAGIFWRYDQPVRRIALLVPQQIVLGISAAGALRAMYLGRFADGAPRAHSFIMADQAPMVLAFATHSMTILFLALVFVRWPNGVP